MLLPKICINFHTKVFNTLYNMGYSLLPHNFVFKLPSNFFCLTRFKDCHFSFFTLNEILFAFNQLTRCFKGYVPYIFASLFCIVSLKHTTCETRKDVFYFTWKALFVLKIIKFWLFAYSNVMASSNAQAWITKHILLNNLGSKHNLVVKFGQLM